MKLTDQAIEQAIRLGKTGLLSDGGGLRLRLTATGGKYWQWRVTVPNDTTISFGCYPEVSIEEARRRHAIAKAEREGSTEKAKLLAAVGGGGKECSVAQLLGRAPLSTDSFEVVSTEWFTRIRGDWVAEYAGKVERMFERDIFPFIGEVPISEVDSDTLLSVPKRIEERKAAVAAHQALELCLKVSHHAMMTGRILSDPGRPLRQRMRRPVAQKTPVVIEFEDLEACIEASVHYAGQAVVKAALTLFFLLSPVASANAIRLMEWASLDAKLTRLKIKSDVITLPPQATEALLDVRTVTGQSRFVFHGNSRDNRAISDNTIMAAFRRMGFDHELKSVGAIARAKVAEVQSKPFPETPAEIAVALQVWANVVDLIRHKGVMPTTSM